MSTIMEEKSCNLTFTVRRRGEFDMIKTTKRYRTRKGVIRVDMNEPHPKNQSKSL